MADTTVKTARESIDRVSWGSVIAGVVTVLAISAILSLLGTAIGSSVIDPMSDDPLDGLGTAFGISTAVFLIISFAAGGFVAGRLANMRGFIHGFLSWATATLISMALIGMAAGNIVSGGAGAVSSIVSGAGQVTGSVAKGVGSAASSLGEQLGNNFDFDPEGDSLLEDQNLQRQVSQVLRDTDTTALQPEYLSDQAQAVGDDIQTAVRHLASSPMDYEAILNNLVDRVQGRLDNIQQNVDRDALVNALSSNTDMSQSDAEQFVDDAMARLDEGVAQMKQQVDRLDTYIKQAQQELAEAEKSLREGAEQAAESLRNAAMMAFIAMIIAALVSSVAGLLGSKMSARHRRA